MRPITYLQDWALRHFFDPELFDLATSGVPFENRVVQPGFDAARFASEPASTTVERACALAGALYGEPAERVLPVLGASGGIVLTALALCDEARAGGVVVESPVYEPLWRTFEAMGASVRFVERRAEHGSRLEAELTTLREAARGAACVVISNPHNPSGVFESRQAIARVAESVAPAWLLVDEVYLPFVRGAETAWGVAPNVAVVSSLTKAWGLGHLRFGWLLAPEPLRSALCAAKFYTPGLFPAPSAAAAIDALERLEPLYAAATAHLAGRKARVAALLADHPVLEWTPPAGDLVISTVRLRGIDDDLAFAERCIAECKVALAPGSFFRAPGTLRLGTGAVPERFDEGLARLIAFAERYPRA